MSKYLQSTAGNYAGWFLPEEAEGLQELLLASAFDAVPGQAVLDAHHLAARLSWSECHQLALAIEAQLQDVGHRRLEEADPDIWLSLPREERNGSHFTLQQELAVMALWKAAAWYRLQCGFGAAVRDLLADRANTDDLHELLVDLQVQRHRDLTRLVYELTRAASLASDSQANGSLQQPALATAQELLAQSRREQSRKAAAARALKYEALRRKVVDLYKQTPRRSRDETATEIHAFLQQEGIELAWTTVRKYLADHDAEVERSRK